MRSNGRNEIGKFSTARCVWARHSAFLGTLTSPMVSCSMRYSVLSRAFSSTALSSAMGSLFVCFVGEMDFRGQGNGWAAVLSPVKSTAEYSLSLESR